MTPEERKAAADAMRTEIDQDRAQARAKQDDRVAKPKVAAPAAAPAAASPAPGSVEAQIDEQRARAGGYFRSQATDHMN